MRTSRWPISHLPISDITPFTYRDGETYLELLNRLSKYITEQLHPNLRKTVEHMVEEMEHIIAAQHNKYVEGVQDFQRIHDAFMEDVNSALMALNDNAISDLIKDPGSTFGRTLRELDLAVTGHWEFRQNDTENGVKTRHVFSRDNGDLYDSDTRLLVRVGQQYSTEHNPPGYSSAELVLEDVNTELASQYRGESTYLRLVSNRLIMNKRLEINMGSGHRATLTSGFEDGDNFARLHMHSATNPSFYLYGDNSASSSQWGNASKQDPAHGGAVVNQGLLRVEAPEGVPLSLMGRADDNTYQEITVFQHGDKSQELVGHIAGSRIGGLRFDDDRYLTLFGHNGIKVSSKMIMNDYFIIPSSDGTQWRISVTNSGTIQATEA